jgi:hypothetical protein
MISCMFSGELGNNLFQLANCLSLTEKLGTNYEILKIRDCYISNDHRPLEIPNLFSHKFNFVNEFSQRYDTYHHNDAVHPTNPEYNFSYQPVKAKDNMLISGYFQSDRYFNDIKYKIVNDYYKFRDSHVNYVRDKYKNIIPDSIAVHVRVGGDRHLLRDSFPIVPSEYYQEAINMICDLRDIQNINVFSDNIAFAKGMFPDNVNFIENETNISDLVFMSLCNHNILGNSTFSWWAAYLNKNKDTMTVAPKSHWFGKSVTHITNIDTLFPEGWITL